LFQNVLEIAGGLVVVEDQGEADLFGGQDVGRTGKKSTVVSWQLSVVSTSDN
jgi:hypothetical protein